MPGKPLSKEEKIAAAHKAGNLIPVRRKVKKKDPRSARVEYTPPRGRNKTKKSKTDNIATEITSKKKRFSDLWKRFGISSKK